MFQTVQDAINSVVTFRLWCRFPCVKAAEHILSDVMKYVSICSAPAAGKTQTTVQPKSLRDVVKL